MPAGVSLSRLWAGEETAGGSSHLMAVGSKLTLTEPAAFRPVRATIGIGASEGQEGKLRSQARPAQSIREG